MLEGFSFLPTTIGYLIATRMLVDIINHLGGIVSTSLSERDHRTPYDMVHIQILNRDMLIPDPRFDFTYGRFIHLFDHNFAQESF